MKFRPKNGSGKAVLCLLAGTLTGSAWGIGTSIGSFENASDMDRLKIYETAPETLQYSLSDEYAADGKQSLKLIFDHSMGYIQYTPEITDWSGYSELRFKVKNMEDIYRYRVIGLVDPNGLHYSDGMNTMPQGMINLPQLEEREFRMDLDAMRDQVDLKNIKAIQIAWGNTDECRMYVDDFRLLTKEEVIAADNAEILAKADNAAERLEAAMGDAGDWKPLAQQYLDAVRALPRDGKEPLKAYDPAIANAADMATTLEMLEQIEEKTPFSWSGLFDSWFGEDPAVSVTAAYPTEKIFRDEPFDGKRDMVISAAGRERESFQLVVIPERPIHEVTVSAGPLTRFEDPEVTIDAANVAVNPVGYVELRNVFYYEERPGWWPDVLHNNRPATMEDGKLRPYWITVSVPADQKPGLYTGSVTVTADGEEAAEFQYALYVFDFTLPLRGRMVTYFDCRTNEEMQKNQELRRKNYEMFLNHRLSPIAMYQSPHSGSELTPKLEDLEFCIERGQNNLVLWYLYDRDNSEPYAFRDEFLQELFDAYASYRDRLAELKALDMTMISCCDEAMFEAPERRDFRIEEVRKAAKKIKSVMPEVKLSNIGPKLTIEPEYMDSWYLLAVPKEQSDDLRAWHKQVGMYWAYENPSFMLDLPGIAPRICAWQALRCGATAMGYYSTNRYWNRGMDAASCPENFDYDADTYKIETQDHRRARNGDGHIVYLDKDSSFLSSIRLENVRDGIEDAEYYLMLKELNPDSWALNIPDAIVDDPAGYWSHYTKDYDVLNAHRLQMASEIEKLQ